MAEVSALVGRAVDLHRQGKLEEAAALYRAVLDSQGDHFNALHLLGVIRTQQGKPVEGVELVSRALEIKPQSFEAHHNLGIALAMLAQYDQAVASYDRALALRPDYGEAHYHRGLALARLNRHGEALASYDSALMTTPRDWRAWYDRGNAQSALGRHDEAVASHDKALELNPRFAPALNNRGAAFMSLGRHEEARSCFDQALAASPDYADAAINLGVSLQHLQRHEEALAIYDRVLATHPAHVKALVERGGVLQSLGRLGDALASYESALRAAPRNAEALNNRGVLLQRIGRYEEALASYERALAADARHVEALNNCGTVLQVLNRDEEALASYDTALAIRPGYADALDNRGIALQALGRDAAAREAWEQALTSDPDHPNAHWNRSLALLAAGDFAEGWKEYEWRWRRSHAESRRYDFTPWRGEITQARRVLLWGEQGIGDEILYGGMLRELTETPLRITLETDPRLVPLFQRSFPSVACVPRSDPPVVNARDFDQQAPLASLGRWLRPGFSAFPRHTGYLKADAARSAFYRDRLRKGCGEEITLAGISWKSMNRRHGAYKSTTLHDWAEILRLPGWRFVDLQYGDTSQERERAKADLAVTIEHLDDLDLTEDLDGVAALSAACDIVITTSNVTAHLAGALGVPVAVLVPRTKGRIWYWFSGRADSPWYPSMRLFRQSHSGQWHEVMEELCSSVPSMSPRRTGGRKPAPKTDSSFDVPVALAEAVKLHRGGRHREAETIYQAVLDREPDQFDALHLLGVLRTQQGQHETAVGLISRAVEQRSASADALANLGAALMKLGRFGEALQSCDRAVHADSRHAEAWCNRGNALAGLSRHRDAIASYDRAIAIRPDDFNALYGRGIALARLQQHEAALTAYREALVIRPRSFNVLHSLGVALANLSRDAEAIGCYDQALAIMPDDATALANRANALTRLERYDDAIAGYEKALQKDPRLPYAAVHVAFFRAHICDWSKRDAGLAHRIRSGLLASPFSVLSLIDDPSIQHTCATAYARDKCPPGARPLCAGTEYRHDRIRIAYLSSDLHDHATAYLASGLFECHDRKRFEVSAISYGPDVPGGMRSRLRGAFEHFLDVRQCTDGEIARGLREREIDIAIDLKGYTSDARPGILALRPAPIQVNYLGYPGTLGAPHIDYLVADRFVIPERHLAAYSENVVYLPDCYQVNDSKRPAAGPPPDRNAAGLPEHGFVFCCFNNNYKIAPEVFDIWMRLLERVEGSALWLLRGTPLAEANLQKEARGRGIDPGRLVFAPRVEYGQHLSRHRLADLFLDTLPCNAHTTASDALWAGVPLVTCAGDAFAARVAGSLLQAVGLPQLITTTLAGYEALALSLATEPHVLRQLRDRLERSRATAVLFDTDRFRRHIEAAYTSMWEIRQRGEPPRPFSVSAFGTD